MKQTKIRNFCIIAHIDHGKSTLADRLLEITGTISKREMKKQLLDTMDLEQEKGITIKLQPVRMHHDDHELNLIDTPGHVDFSYEVSRSLQACEGALLVVDATQGIQAQTLANVYLAIEAGLEIIPVINKIDLPASNVDKVSKEIINLLGCTREDIHAVSAKTGEGVAPILDDIIDKVPQPKGDDGKSLRALVFDSQYDEYRGVILYVRVVDGSIDKNQDLHMMATDKPAIANNVGHFSPGLVEDKKLIAGQIGYVVTNLKSVSEARVGDTVTSKDKPADSPLPGYKKVQPFVFAGIFPVSADDYQDLKDAIERLSLNDSSLVFTPENSQVLGFGFRVGFLGLLHMEIIKERLEREFDLELIITNPSTEYEVITIDGEEERIKSASLLPDPVKIQAIKEPWINGEVVTPSEYIGPVIQLISSIRGLHKNTSYMDETMALLTFEAPLANVLTNFYDQLKSITSGYGSLNYEIKEYREEDLVRVDILVAGDMIDSLSQIVHRSEAERIGRTTLEKLKDVVPRQQFQVALQAAIGGKIIARENISALGKNVTGHLYGGDVSRKKKLWAKQKKGKARMKKFGNVEIPPEAFTTLLKKD